MKDDIKKQKNNIEKWGEILDRAYDLQMAMEDSDTFGNATFDQAAQNLWDEVGEFLETCAELEIRERLEAVSQLAQTIDNMDELEEEYKKLLAEETLQ